jgi:hypothetical protein
MRTNLIFAGDVNTDRRNLPTRSWLFALEMPAASDKDGVVFR